MTLRFRSPLCLLVLSLAPAFAGAQEDDPGLEPMPAPPPRAAPPRAKEPPPTTRPARESPTRSPVIKDTSPAARNLPPSVHPTAEAPVKEEVKEEIKILPASAVSDEEWELRLQAPSLGGSIGLFRTQTAEVGLPLHFRVGAHVQAFTQSSFLVAGVGNPGDASYNPGDNDARFLGDLTIGITGPDLMILRNLELYIGIFNASNQNRRTDPGRTDPTVILALADVAVGLKAAFEAFRGVGLGANFGMRFFNSISGVTAESDAMSFDMNFIGTFDLRQYVASVPLRFHFNGGYYIDRSLALLPHDASGNSTQCTTSTGNDACIRSRVVETFAYGLSTPRGRISFALDAPLRPHVPWGVFGVDPFVEYHVEAAAGKGDQTVATALVAQADKDQGACMAAGGTAADCASKEADFRHRISNTLSQYITIGLRLRPVAGLVVDVGMDFNLQSPGFQHGPPMPIWNLIVGAAYAFDPFAGAVKQITRTVTRTYEADRKAAENQLAITVLDVKTHKPVAGAIVRYPGRGLSAQAAGDDGKVKSYGLPPGPVTVEVTRNGYDDEQIETSVEAGSTRPLEVLLKPQPPKEGKVRVRVLDDRGAGLPGATVKLNGPNGSKDAGLDGDAFAAAVPGGDYTITVEAPSFLAKEKQILVVQGQEQIVELQLHRRPLKSHVEVTGDQILIKGTIHFATNEATILPDGQQILDEVVDVLAKNQQIRKVSVEGHTDNVGTPAKNLQLSKERAAAVVTYMSRNGIGKDRLTSEGYGQTKPLVPNLTPANRARNRRVEFKIVDGGSAGADKPGFRE